MRPRAAVPRRPRVLLETMGCKLNLADTELLARDFLRAGFEVVAPQSVPDVYVLNTCTVTHVADRKARHFLRSARRKYPHAYLVATGCYAQRAPNEVATLLEVDLVAGNTSKPVLVQLVTEGLVSRGVPSVPLPRLPDVDLPPRGSILPHQTRAFVKLQEGCNDYCSYCIIPKTRGTSRSFSHQQIIAEIREREAAGYQEVVLTGTQLGDYGIDLPGSRRQGPDQQDQASQGNPLAALLQRVLAETTIPRVRLSSLQPQDVTPQLLDLWQDTRLCRHFHLPLQSGADAVLRGMRRRYTTKEYAAVVEEVCKVLPDVSITTDVIAGFPGETEEDFQATLAFCEPLAFADIHVFPYSLRQGTLATRFAQQVPEAVKQERVRGLLALAQRSSAAHRDRFLESQQTVLWEDHRLVPEVAEGPVWQGLTDNYLRVYCNDGRPLGGLVLPTRLVRRVAQGIWGEVAQ